MLTRTYWQHLSSSGKIFLYFVQYVNGSLVAFGHSRNPGGRPERIADEAGVYLHFNGNEAIFRDLRVSALAE